MKGAGFIYGHASENSRDHPDELPDYLTQGTSLEDLKAHLADLHLEPRPTFP